MENCRARGAIGAAALVLILTAGCAREPPPPLRFDTSRVSVQNRTDRAWADVEIWVNDHYRAQAATLAPGQVLDVPLDAFVAGFGQRFNAKKTPVYGIAVSSIEGGARVTRITWGRGRKRF